MAIITEVSLSLRSIQLLNVESYTKDLECYISTINSNIKSFINLLSLSDDGRKGVNIAIGSQCSRI